MQRTFVASGVPCRGPERMSVASHVWIRCLWPGFLDKDPLLAVQIDSECIRTRRAEPIPELRHQQTAALGLDRLCNHR